MSKFVDSIMLVLKGVCVGIADAVPGVSGGTIAFILKIYDRLLDAIDLNPKKLIKNLPFLIPLYRNRGGCFLRFKGAGVFV